jgi:hypothetical protein
VYRLPLEALYLELEEQFPSQQALALHPQVAQCFLKPLTLV